MANDTAPLTHEERAELEQLRAEKAAREEAERAAAERAELERLRAEKARSAAPGAASRREWPRASRDDQRVIEARERGRRLMEPGDDLSMPLGQKIVLAVIAVIVVAVVAALALGPR